MFAQEERCSRRNGNPVVSSVTPEASNKNKHVRPDLPVDFNEYPATTATQH